MNLSSQKLIPSLLPTWKLLRHTRGMIQRIKRLYDVKIATYSRTDSRYITEDQWKSTAELIRHITHSNILSTKGLKMFDVNNVYIDQIINNKKSYELSRYFVYAEVKSRCFFVASHRRKNIILLIIYKVIMAVAVIYAYATTKIDFDISGYHFKSTEKTVQ